MKTPLLAGLLAGLCLPAPSATPATESSALWGSHGEHWTSSSRLPDFSFAGYRRGERPLPQLPTGVNVKDFGAVGDGEADDTQAFQTALAQAPVGAIEVPAGRYRITGLLEILRPGIVLRGAGPDKSILVFPRPLNDLKPDWGATTTGGRTSNYSWSGGFITLRGSFGSSRLTDIAQPARRGQTEIVVASTAGLRVGQEVEVYQADRPDNSLAVHLYSGDAGPVENLRGRATASLVARIVALDGPRVSLDRALRCDLQPAWQPQLRAFAPTVTESGVEHLGFEFPAAPYRGHFTELGFNPVALQRVAHCWLRNLRVRNPDSGPFVTGFFNTVEGLVLESERGVDARQCNGHHGVMFTHGGDNLLRRFDVRMRFIHDVTVSWFTAGNVVADGRAVDLCLDHHRHAPNENLFTALDAGAGTRLWSCGGGAALGKHAGARETFWNLRAAQPLQYPPAGFGPPTLNLVALTTRSPSTTALDGLWFEAIAPDAIQPQNLYEAQRAKRLAARPGAPAAAKPIRHPGIDQYAAQLAAYAQQPDAWSERYRPRFHFTPFRYWQNDPNGLAWFNGEWHLFFQHYLDDLCGVSWGHAISTDLVHWRHLPPAIPADPLGAIYSGSGVVDTRDTSGFFGGRPGYVGIFTYHSRDNWESQGIAYSPDGRAFFSFAGNPAIPELRHQPGQKPDPAFRDPKVFWHEPTQRWIMVVAGGTLRIFSSPNLRDWTFESINPAIHTECPDLFQLPVEGRPGERRWVFSKGGFGYLLGDFDGHRFTPTSAELPFNYGTDFYAMQSWDNAPGGRVVATSWLYFWGYQGRWLGPEGNAQTLPVELSLCPTAGGELRVRQTPVPELQQLRGDAVGLREVTVPAGRLALPQVRGQELEVIAEFELGSATEVGLILAEGRGGEGVVLGYNRERGEVFLDRSRAGWEGLAGIARAFEGPLALANDRVKFHVFLDRTSVELFAADGLANITAAVLPQPASDGLSVFAVGGPARLVALEAFPLRSIHPASPAAPPPRVDLWPTLSMVQGRERWLSARAWPQAVSDLRWTSADPAALEILETAGEWVRFKAHRPGTHALTATLPGGPGATCNVQVAPDTLQSDVDFVFTNPGWAIGEGGLRYRGDTPSALIANASAPEGRWSADVTLETAGSAAGLLIRAEGQTGRGFGLELRAADRAVVAGNRGKASQAGHDVRITLAQHTRPLAVPTGRPVRLEIEWGASRYRCRVDGAEAFDLPPPNLAPWTRCLGLSATGSAVFQNIRLEARGRPGG